MCRFSFFIIIIIIKSSLKILKEHKFYKSNEDAIATLILNEDLKRNNIEIDHHFRTVKLFHYYRSSDINIM
jgi:hypothetical protein